MFHALILYVRLSTEVGCRMGDGVALRTAGREGPPEAGDRAQGGSRELGLYPDFLGLRLGLEAKLRLSQEDEQLLGGGKRQEPHKMTLF